MSHRPRLSCMLHAYSQMPDGSVLSSFSSDCKNPLWRVAPPSVEWILPWGTIYDLKKKKRLIIATPSITFWGGSIKNAKTTTVHLYLNLNCLNANYQLILLSKLLSVMGCHMDPNLCLEWILSWRNVVWKKTIWKGCELENGTESCARQDDSGLVPST